MYKIIHSLFKIKTLSIFIVTFTFFVTNIFVTSSIHCVARLLSFIFVLFLFCHLKNSLLKFLIFTPFALLVSIDIGLNSYSWFTFHSAFSDGFAASILDTNPREGLSMLGVYSIYAVISFVFFILLFFSIQASSTHKKPVIISGSLLAILLTVNISSTFGYIKKSPADENKILLLEFASRLSTYLPFFNLSYFITAIQQSNELDYYRNQIVYHSLVTHDTGINTYVLVLGESERIANMQSYGYGRQTTPELEKALPQVSLFENAVSGAPYTALAVPLALSADTLEDHRLVHYSDNVINLANQAGFKTFWFSEQTAFGNHGTAVSAIAKNATKSIYLANHDEELLPLLRQALSDPAKKKFIVLHLYGSHEPACKRFPTRETLFKDGDKAIDCYDNSVRYTDKILGQIFHILQGTPASVLYFSDHALEYNPKESSPFYHGGVKPSQEAYRVPMFLWFSDNRLRQGLPLKIEQHYSTTYNYWLINAWLGITLKHSEEKGDLQQVINLGSQETRVMDSNGTLYYFSTLKPHL